MKQLNMQTIYLYCQELKSKGYNLEDIPIYLGNDEELNGVHNAWYCELINVKDKECEDIIDLIREDNCNIDIIDSAVLIS